MTEETAMQEKQSVKGEPDPGTKHLFWSNQLDAFARELSRLAVACKIDVFESGVAERILRNDESVCGVRNPAAFKKIRMHLMGYFSVKGSALDRLGPEGVKEMMDPIWDAIRTLCSGGKAAAPTANSDNKD
jgi:hypothetical protein